MTEKLEKVMTDKELLRRLKEYSQDWDWVCDNREELTKLFPDHFIAVKDMVVHYTETDMERLCVIMELGGDEPADWVVEFMNVKPHHFILATTGVM